MTGKAAANVPAPDLRKIGSALADRAEELLEVVEQYQVSGSANGRDIDTRRWRLGAALADWWEATDEQA